MKNEWDLVIKPKAGWLQFNLNEIWTYRDLLMLLVRRDFVSTYKQTILGPAWFIIQPILTTITFTIIFSSLANLSTDNIPPVLFYLTGITFWSYFSDCLTKTSNTFVANAGVFGKVYFPRLVVPLSVLISNLIKLGIQFLVFFAVWAYYFKSQNKIEPNWGMVWLIPLLVILMAGLGLGLGILISSLTTKYRDLVFLVSFGVQLLMYASPIVYPMSIVDEKYKTWILLNPITSIIESFKYIFLGTDYFSWSALGYSASFMFVVLFFSILIFSKVEKTFMDTV